MPDLGAGAALAPYGLVGFLLLVSGYLNWFQKKELSDSWAARLSDAQTSLEILATVRATLEQISAVTEARTRSQESMSQAQLAAAAEASRAAVEMTRMREEIAALRAELRSMREAIFTPVINSRTPALGGMP